jgi:hypothetical protein
MEQQKDLVRHSRRSRQEIESLIAKFGKGTMTVKQFCADHNIKPATFHKWQARRKKKSYARPAEPGFAEIKLQSSLPGLFAEVNGIRIYRQVPASFLKELAS